MIHLSVASACAQVFRDPQHNMTIKREDRRRAAVEKQIDENLKRVYEQDVTDDVPDRFMELLQKLKEQEVTSSRSSSASGGT